MHLFCKLACVCAFMNWQQETPWPVSLAMCLLALSPSTTAVCVGSAWQSASLHARCWDLCCMPWSTSMSATSCTGKLSAQQCLHDKVSTAILGSLVSYLASHYIDAKRCGLFFNFSFLQTAIPTRWCFFPCTSVCQASCKNCSRATMLSHGGHLVWNLYAKIRQWLCTWGNACLTSGCWPFTCMRNLLSYISLPLGVIKGSIRQCLGYSAHVLKGTRQQKQTAAWTCTCTMPCMYTFASTDLGLSSRSGPNHLHVGCSMVPSWSPNFELAQQYLSRLFKP